MRFESLIALACLLTIQICQKCDGFGLRLSFGEYFHVENSQQKLVVTFNTRQDCKKSYIILNKNDSHVQKIYCSQKLVRLTESLVTPYQTYIQRCVVQQIELGMNFKYMAYGWTGNQQDMPQPFGNNPISSFIFDPKNYEQIKFITLGDWGFLRQKKGRYDSLDSSFQQIIDKFGNKISGVLIIGDVGYDLDSNNCRNYEDYLIMSSGISRYYPTVYITGNHEYNSKNNMKLFVSSFQLYQLDTNLVTQLNLGPFTLVMFDPHQSLYNPQQLTQQDLLLVKFVKTLDQASLLNKSIVVSSHYPLICSGVSKFCTSVKMILKSYFDSMFDHSVPLYLGAHVHTYQRIYPIYKNQQISIKQSPYYPNNSDRFMISIIEGAAGNDQEIVESYPDIKPFTASFTSNETGFGILTANKNLQYEHYSAKNGLHLTDRVEINPSYSSLLLADE